MDTLPDRARVRYVVEMWVDVDLAELSIDRVVVDTDGLSHPLQVLTSDGQELSEGSRQAVLEVVSSETWPSWDYE
ncbi:MAG: hypothetical protein ACRD29_16865 [Acidimicrobiales bacterium]